MPGCSADRGAAYCFAFHALDSRPCGPLPNRPREESCRISYTACLPPHTRCHTTSHGYACIVSFGSAFSHTHTDIIFAVSEIAARGYRVRVAAGGVIFAVSEIAARGYRVCIVAAEVIFGVDHCFSMGSICRAYSPALVTPVPSRSVIGFVSTMSPVSVRARDFMPGSG